jgi:hypothetical protein
MRCTVSFLKLPFAKAQQLLLNARVMHALDVSWLPMAAALGGHTWVLHSVHQAFDFLLVSHSHNCGLGVLFPDLRVLEVASAMGPQLWSVAMLQSRPDFLSVSHSERQLLFPSFFS